MFFFEFYLANPAQKKPCKLPAPLFMFSHMGQIWCQFFCDFMKISRFENVLFVCLNFCVSLRITCKGVENESFQEFSIISQKLKACSTCSKNPPDGPPHIQVQNEQYMWLSSSSIWENIKRGGVNQRRNAGFFQIFMSYFQTFYRCCFVVFLHFFSVLKLIFKIFFDRFSGNFRLSRQD